MKGLRGRLFFSYLLLLSITLGAFAVALIVILNTRPAPPQASYQRLTTIALTSGLRDMTWARRIAPVLSLQQSLRTIGERLDDEAEQQGVRIMLVGMPNRIVVHDSAKRLQPGEQLRGNFENYIIPAQLLRNLIAQFRALVGSYFDDGEEWVFVGLESFMLRGETYYLLYAEPRQRQSLQDALSEFGTELLPVIGQAALSGLIVAALLAIVISRSIARPLQTVAEAAAKVVSGQGTHQVPVEGPREVRAVAEAFNKMAAEVQQEKRVQQEFLANVSHDLKTPLTSIQGYSQAIIDNAIDDPVRAARIIYDEAARLNRMVVELTDLTRLQSGRLEMRLSTVDINQLVESIGQRLAIVAREKDITFTIETIPLAPIAADGDRLAQVLTNVLSNAIKFTPRGGRVHLRTSSRDGGIEIAVSDTGIGIAPADLPRVFERFYQVDKTRGPRRGTGLGLAIAQEIVTAHGGTIWAESAGPGHGSTFRIWLPAAPVETARRW